MQWRCADQARRGGRVGPSPPGGGEGAPLVLLRAALRGAPARFGVFCGSTPRHAAARLHERQQLALAQVRWRPRVLDVRRRRREQSQRAPRAHRRHRAEARLRARRHRAVARAAIGRVAAEILAVVHGPPHHRRPSAPRAARGGGVEAHLADCRRCSPAAVSSAGGAGWWGGGGGREWPMARPRFEAPRPGALRTRTRAVSKAQSSLSDATNCRQISRYSSQPHSSPHCLGVASLTGVIGGWSPASSPSCRGRLSSVSLACCRERPGSAASAESPPPTLISSLRASGSHSAACSRVSVPARSKPAA